MGKSTGLIKTHEAGVTDYVGRQDCCEPPSEAFFGHALDMLREGPTGTSLWITWWSVYRVANDRFGSSSRFFRAAAYGALSRTSLEFGLRSAIA